MFLFYTLYCKIFTDISFKGSTKDCIEKWIYNWIESVIFSFRNFVWQLRDCELGATLNRELKQRVRPVNGISAHKQIVRADIKQAAKIIQILDSKWGMWEDPEDEKKDKSKEVCQGQRPGFKIMKLS